MRYNNKFGMRDFFCNKELTGIVPQIKPKDLESGKLSDYKICMRCRDVIKDFVGGAAKGYTITVEGKPKSTVLSAVRLCATVLEGMFNNSEELLDGIKSNKKLYTSAASISQVKGFVYNREKLKFLKEILDNMNYNPEFNSENSIASNSPVPYKERQEKWMKKVGYKTEQIRR